MELSCFSSLALTPSAWLAGEEDEEKQSEKRKLTSKIGRQQRVSKEGHLVGTKSQKPLHQKSGEYRLDQLHQFPALSPRLILKRHQYTISISGKDNDIDIQLTLWPVA